MNKLIAYLKTNWKHITVAAIMAIYNILIAAGVIPANDQLIINAVLAALGISLTSNSGTKDAISNTQQGGGVAKMIVIGFALLLPAVSSAQSNSLIQMPGTKWNLAGDTIINTGTAADTLLMSNAYATGSVVTYITKVSGTVSPTLTMQGSVDGHAWVSFGDTVYTPSNVTGTTTYTWPCLAPVATKYYATPPILPFLYYRVEAAGTGTMKAIIKSYFAVR